MGQLTLHFRGICAHFRNVVPGIAHRAVLPNATQVRFGFLDAPGTSSPLPYVIPPHIAGLLLPEARHQEMLEVPGAMLAGVIYGGVRIQVANAEGNEVLYEAGYEEVARMVDYVPDYQFADEVVMGGRASCYFDIVSGVMNNFGKNTGDRNLIGVQATIQTDGPPVLAITPFFHAPGDPLKVTTIELPQDEVDMVVANIGLGCDDGSDSFDFLLNYLARKGGIPRFVTQPLPGMRPELKPIDLAIVTKWLEWASAGILPKFDGVMLPAHPDVLLSPTLACSDTRYP